MQIHDAVGVDVASGNWLDPQWHVDQHLAGGATQGQRRPTVLIRRDDAHLVMAVAVDIPGGIHPRRLTTEAHLPRGAIDDGERLVEPADGLPRSAAR